MADVTISAPFTLELKGDVFIDAAPTDKKAEAQVASVSSFDYTVDGETYDLPTSEGGRSTATTDDADLTALSDTGGGQSPPNPFVVRFNTGTASRVPATGSPYIVKIVDVDEDLIIGGASSATTYESGGVVVLDGGGSVDGPTHPEE